RPRRRSQRTPGPSRPRPSLFPIDPSVPPTCRRTDHLGRQPFLTLRTAGLALRGGCRATPSLSEGGNAVRASLQRNLSAVVPELNYRPIGTGTLVRNVETGIWEDSGFMRVYGRLAKPTHITNQIGERL